MVFGREGGVNKALNIKNFFVSTKNPLGRLETLGPGGTAALRRRQQAADLEKTWQLESRAQLQAARGSYRGLRSGFAKLD